MLICLWNWWISWCVFLTILRWQELQVFQSSIFSQEDSRSKLLLNSIEKLMKEIWSSHMFDNLKEVEVMKWGMKELLLLTPWWDFMKVLLLHLILHLCILLLWWLIIYVIQHLCLIISQSLVKDCIKQFQSRSAILLRLRSRKVYFQWFLKNWLLLESEQE